MVKANAKCGSGSDAKKRSKRSHQRRDEKQKEDALVSIMTPDIAPGDKRGG